MKKSQSFCNFKKRLIPVICALTLLFSINSIALCSVSGDSFKAPVYTGTPYAVINSNMPGFSTKMISDAQGKVYESYGKMDSLGRCGVCVACIDKTLMPTEPRGEIGSVKPSGWHTVKYNDLIDGNYLYNRCHLIGYQLTGENANKKNLITGTRYLNVEGMLPFENKVANYIEKTGNKVLYRVTPIYEGANLVASGVQMEAYSLADNGKSICFNVYCFNVQPGIVINYADGESFRADGYSSVVPSANNASSDMGSKSNNNSDNSAVEKQTQPTVPTSSEMVWLSATGSKYHSKNNCGKMNPDKARQVTLKEAQDKGYERCSKCW